MTGAARGRPRRGRTTPTSRTSCWSPYDAKVTRDRPRREHASRSPPARRSTDADGTRQATCCSTPGTNADDGAPERHTSSRSATSTCARPSSPSARTARTRCRATLPPTLRPTPTPSSLSVDEAVAAGATDVRFDKPVVNYVDNFLGFPVGGDRPDRLLRPRGRRVGAAPNGRVIKIVWRSSTAGRTSTPTATAWPTTASASTTPSAPELAEHYATRRRAVARRDRPLHAVGPQLALRARPGRGRRRRRSSRAPTSRPTAPSSECQAAARSSRCQDQTLGEELAVTGTPFKLATTRAAPAAAPTARLEIPLTGRTIPPSLQQRRARGLRRRPQEFTQDVRAQGRTSPTSSSGTASDAYGRPVQGRQPVDDPDRLRLRPAPLRHARPSSTPRSASSPARRARSSARSATSRRSTSAGARCATSSASPSARSTPAAPASAAGSSTPPRLRRAHAHALPR